ncbi:Protein Gawky [Halotydeus destructor]|nr:Protein Gawky [Halotydeus destructor]
MAAAPRQQTSSDNSNIASAVSSAPGWGNSPVVEGRWTSQVNQDNAWDLPPSPQSSPKESNSVWRNNSTTGTEIWETTVRKAKGGSAASSSSVAAAPPATPAWAHTPSTHHGGTWGEEEDASTHWTGVPQSNGGDHGSGNSNASTNSDPYSWGGGGSRDVPDNSDTNWNKPSNNRPIDEPSVARGSNAQWASNAQTNKNWGESVEPVKVHSDNAGTAAWGGTGRTRSPPQQAPLPVPVAKPPPVQATSDASNTFGNWSPKKESQGWDKDENGDKKTVFDDGTAVWGAPARQHKPVNRWKEEDEAAPKNTGESSVCANGNSNVPSHSGANSYCSNLPPASPGMIRLPSGAPPMNSKPSNTVWNKSQVQENSRFNNAWPEGGGNQSNNQVQPQQQPQPNRDSVNPVNSANSGWGQVIAGESSNIKSVPATPSTPNGVWGQVNAGGEGLRSVPNTPSAPSSGWGDPVSSPPSSYWNAKNRNSNSWSDGQIDTRAWSGPKQKPLTKEMIWASKPFRQLTDLGLKREDVENALRATNMNFEEAISFLGELRAYAPKESIIDMNNKVKAPGQNSNTSSLLTSSGMANPSLSSINSRSPSQMSQIHQANSAQQSQAYPSVNQLQSALQRNTPRVSSTQNNPPSEKQLYHLVQQIQLAVQTGHLNAQILNQPLAPPTIHLIYELLQQIKFLQQLQVQIASTMSKPGQPANSTYQSQLHVQITQTKQRISNFQNQIAVSQAMYLKQQQHQQFMQHQGHATPVSGSAAAANHSGAAMHSAASPHSALNFIKASGGDNSALGLAMEFRDLTIKDYIQPPQTRMKSTSWKLPSYDKEDANEFSRAPGSNATKAQQPQGSGSLLSRPESDMWTGIDVTESPHWPSNGSASSVPMGDDLLRETNIGKSVSGQTYFSDLVPEFEPGKPWKGSQMKNIEDDPHITPGSVNRSPLSVNTIFSNEWSAKMSPTASSTSGPNDAMATSLSLSSNTWAFPPSSSSLYNETPKATDSKGYNWGSDNPNLGDSLVWSSSILTKPREPTTRGPPPGMTDVKTSVSDGQNGSSSATNFWNAGNDNATNQLQPQGGQRMWD